MILAGVTAQSNEAEDAEILAIVEDEGVLADFLETFIAVIFLGGVEDILS